MNSALEVTSWIFFEKSVPPHCTPQEARRKIRRADRCGGKKRTLLMLSYNRTQNADSSAGHFSVSAQDDIRNVRCRIFLKKIFQRMNVECILRPAADDVQIDYVQADRMLNRKNNSLVHKQLLRLS